MKANEVAPRVELIVLDVDGVLTDGGVYYDGRGEVSKRFNIQDGLGIKLAQAAGLDVAVISGLDSLAVESRIRELGIEEYYAGHNEKIPLLEKICAKLDIDLQNTAYMGDDWVDAVPMRKVGLPMAVANAQPEIKELALWVSKSVGGDGAVREAIRFILDSRGMLHRIWKNWAGDD